LFPSLSLRGILLVLSIIYRETANVKGIYRRIKKQKNSKKGVDKTWFLLYNSSCAAEENGKQNGRETTAFMRKRTLKIKQRKERNP
jgi:hypothetical protein